MKIIAINQVHYTLTGWRDCKTGGNASMNTWIAYYKGMGVTAFNLQIEREDGTTYQKDINAEEL